MNWLLSILKLVPYIAAGVQVIHQDASAGEKKQIAGDLIGLATAGSQQVLSADNAEIAATIGQSVQTTVSAIIDALHNGNTAVKK